MAALTANTTVQTKALNEIFGGRILKFDVIAADIIYKGALVELGTNGVQPASGDEGTHAIGIAMEKVDNSAGLVGAKQVDVLVGGAFTIAAITNLTDESQLGEAVYTASDNVADLTNVTTNTFVGNVAGYTGGAGNRFIVKMTDHIAVESYTITNITADRTMDCNAAADAEIADVLATLIQDLRDKGIVTGTIA